MKHVSTTEVNNMKNSGFITKHFIKYLKIVRLQIVIIIKISSTSLF